MTQVEGLEGEAAQRQAVGAAGTEPPLWALGGWVGGPGKPLAAATACLGFPVQTSLPVSKSDVYKKYQASLSQPFLVCH